MDNDRQKAGRLRLPQNHSVVLGERSSATGLPWVTGPEHRLSLPPRRLSGCAPYEVELCSQSTKWHAFLTVIEVAN